MVTPDDPDNEQPNDYEVGTLLARLRALAFNVAEKTGATRPDDVAQEVMIAYCSQNPPPHKPEAWIRHVARNRAISFWRWENGQPPPIAMTESPDTADPEDTERRCVHLIMIDELTALAHDILSPRQLDAYRALLKSEGYVADAVKLVADTYDCNGETVRSHLNRAIAKLQLRGAYLAAGADPDLPGSDDEGTQR
ncbi:MAG: sigma-70 family RNA polymerase sigma factor [Actinomycetota bacterium]